MKNDYISNDTYSEYLFPSVVSAVKNAYEFSGYYKDLWKNSLKTNKIDDWNDFLKLEPAGKLIFKTEDLKDNLAVKEDMIAYYYFSGGTTGKPKIIPATKKEWKSRNQYRAECYRLAGFTKYDSVWIALPFGPWSVGHSAQHAFHILGSNVMPAGLSSDSSILKYIWKQAKMMNINAIITTPSILRFIENSINEKSLLPIEKVVTTGENVTAYLRNYYKKKYNIDIIASYGSSECFIGIECPYKCGYHYDPREIFIETVDKKNVPANSGSVLLTNLKSEALPLIRYKIGDLGKIHYDKCKCGSHWPRLEWMGRDNNFYELSGGANFYTYQIVETLAQMKRNVYECEVLITDNEKGKDIVEFVLYCNDDKSSKINDQAFLKHAMYLFENLSLDFRDVIFDGFVEIKARLMKIKEKQIFRKTQIKIIDSRKFKK